MGALAKTDQVDARTLRDFADVLARHQDRAKYITPMLDDNRRQLAELMTRRRQLVDMRVAENNHLEHAGKRSVRSIKSVLRPWTSSSGRLTGRSMTTWIGTSRTSARCWTASRAWDR
jgi:transposase